MIRIKRAYDPASEEDGIRVLVDHVWPRGLSKERARLDRWWKEIAPSDGLRKWFSHDPAKWEEFRRRYHDELRERGPDLEKMADESKKKTVTLVYAARDEQHNNARALRDFLEEM